MSWTQPIKRVYTTTNMEFRDEPLAYFITWMVYGTFLHGDCRWWRQKGVSQPPRPLLERWHRDRLKHDLILLNRDHCTVVREAIAEHCDFRDWALSVANVRSNHVHVVVTSPGYLGTKVRDQLKANATRGLREVDEVFQGRPVWTTKGDVELVWKEDELERVIQYAGEAQDRMGARQMSLVVNEGLGRFGPGRGLAPKPLELGAGDSASNSKPRNSSPNNSSRFGASHGHPQKTVTVPY